VSRDIQQARPSPLRRAFALTLTPNDGTGFLLFGCVLLYGLALLVRASMRDTDLPLALLATSAFLWSAFATSRAVAGLVLLAGQCAPYMRPLRRALIGGPWLLGVLLPVTLAAAMQLPVLGALHLSLRYALLGMLLMLLPQSLLAALGGLWLGSKLLQFPLPALSMLPAGADIAVLALLAAWAWRRACRTDTSTEGWSAPLALAGRRRSILFGSPRNGVDPILDWVRAAPSTASAARMATVLGAPFHHHGVAGLLRLLAPAICLLVLFLLLAMSAQNAGFGDLLFAAVIASALLAAAPASRLRALRREPSAELAELTTLPGLAAPRVAAAGLLRCVLATVLRGQLALALPILVLGAASDIGSRLLLAYALAVAGNAVAAVALAAWAAAQRPGLVGLPLTVAMAAVFMLFSISAVVTLEIRPDSVAPGALAWLPVLAVCLALFAVGGWRALSARPHPFLFEAHDVPLHARANVQLLAGARGE
jgi:hypothetical protein